MTQGDCNSESMGAVRAFDIIRQISRSANGTLEKTWRDTYAGDICGKDGNFGRSDPVLSCIGVREEKEIIIWAAGTIPG